MAVTFDGLRLAVHLCGKSSWHDIRWPAAQTHGSAFHSYLLLVLEQTDDGVRRVFLEFGAVGAFEAADISRELEGGNLHSETKTKIGYAPLSGVSAGDNFAFDTAIAETSRHN